MSSTHAELKRSKGSLTGITVTPSVDVVYVVVIDAVFALLYVFVMLVYSWQLTLVTVAVIPALGDAQSAAEDFARRGR